MFQAAFQHLGKGLDLTDDELEILLAALFGRQGGDLILEFLPAFLRMTEPWLELGPIHQTILIGIDETADATFDLLCQRL